MASTDKGLTKDIIAEYEGTDLDTFFESVDEEFLSNLGVDDINTTVKKMLQDDQVSSELESFKTHIENTAYIIQPPDEKQQEIADIYNGYLTRDGNHLMMEINNFLEALEYGSVICQVIWKHPKDMGGDWVIDRLKPLDHIRYGFNKRGQMIDRENRKILDNPYRFISVSHNVRGGNLEGNSLLLKAYWPWWFRKECIKAGLLYVKKAIIPSIIALYKAAQNKAETKADGELIGAQLKKLANRSGVALANVEEVKSFNATSKGTDLIDMIELFNRMISKALLGTSTLTNDSKYSNRGDTTAQKELIVSRAQKVTTGELQNPINTVLYWTYELNRGFLDQKLRPTFKYIYEYDPSFEEVMSALEKRVPTSGVWFYNKFNIKPPEDEDDSLVKAQVLPEAPALSSDSDNGFFFSSERPKHKPVLMSAISRASQNIMGKK